jgi:hypothetical protein
MRLSTPPNDLGEGEILERRSQPLDAGDATGHLEAHHRAESALLRRGYRVSQDALGVPG